jgi:NAD(P)-dependent dehydrogenase (short-subunit alcohol dehydrogenase family)
MLLSRTVIISGATGGLGPAVAKAMLDDGAAVVAVARDRAELDALQATLAAPEGRWLSIAADLTDAAGTAAVVDEAISRFGGVDIVIAVAGGWRGGKPVAETDLAILDWLWKINVVTAFNICRAALPHLSARGWGRIITIGSRSAVAGQARSGAYAASKAAVVALTQSIAAEVRGAGVTANVILPSTIDTPANRASAPDADLTKWVTPEQIAAAVRFLCSEDASAINGAAIPVYGRA